MPGSLLHRRRKTGISQALGERIGRNLVRIIFDVGPLRDIVGLRLDDAPGTLKSRLADLRRMEDELQGVVAQCRRRNAKPETMCRMPASAERGLAVDVLKNPGEHTSSIYLRWWKPVPDGSRTGDAINSNGS